MEVSTLFAPEPDMIDPASRAKVLVVDDDYVTAKSMVHQLEYVGYQASYALSGMDALDRLGEDNYDVLLADIYMPEMRGDELQSLAYRIDPDIIVLMVTASDDVNCAVSCMRDGAYDYLIKPVSTSTLGARIQKAIERRQWLAARHEHRADLERKIAEATDHVKRVFQGSLDSLSKTLSAKDLHTGNHSSRVSELAAAVAARMRPNEKDFIAQVRVGSLFHDIGKIGISESILAKPGPLTPEEEAEIQKHPEIGESILQPIFGRSEVLSIARSHHEHFNGRGYPDGLAGTDISLGARIVAVVDSFDAMTQNRPYRAGMEVDHAVQILVEGAGSQWDPEIVNTFLDTLAADDRVRTASPLPRVPLVPRSRGPVMFIHNDLDKETLDKLQLRVEALRRRGTIHFIVDLRNAGYISKAGAELFWRLHQTITLDGGRMAIRDAPEQILSVFRQTGLADRLALERSPIRIDGALREYEPRRLI